MSETGEHIQGSGYVAYEDYGRPEFNFTMGQEGAVQDPNVLGGNIEYGVPGYGAPARGMPGALEAPMAVPGGAEAAIQAEGLRDLGQFPDVDKMKRENPILAMTGQIDKYEGWRQRAESVGLGRAMRIGRAAVAGALENINAVTINEQNEVESSVPRTVFTLGRLIVGGPKSKILMATKAFAGARAGFAEQTRVEEIRDQYSNTGGEVQIVPPSESPQDSRDQYDLAA